MAELQTAESTDCKTREAAGMKNINFIPLGILPGHGHFRGHIIGDKMSYIGIYEVAMISLFCRYN